MKNFFEECDNHNIHNDSNNQTPFSLNTIQNLFVNANTTTSTMTTTTTMEPHFQLIQIKKKLFVNATTTTTVTTTTTTRTTTTTTAAWPNLVQKLTEVKPHFGFAKHCNQISVETQTKGLNKTIFFLFSLSVQEAGFEPSILR